MSTKVFIQKGARHKIARCVYEQQNCCETGGLLIGYILANVSWIIDITNSNGIRDNGYSFYLDGEQHTKEYERVIKKYLIKPQIVGVWHSHTYGISHFSQQDKIANRQFCKIFGNTVSALITDKNDILKIDMYYLTEKEEEKRIKTFFVK